MPSIRPFALAKQLAAIPFHFCWHQWKGMAVPRPQTIAFGPHARQYLQYWIPPKGVPIRSTAVFFLHGGGWRLGWPNQFPTVADWFLRRGYMVMMPAYRLCPRFAYPDMRKDLNWALAKSIEILQSAPHYPQKMLIGGMSAGATLAAHLAFNRNELADLCMTPTHFAGFLSLGGPLDLNQMPNLVPIRNFTRGKPGSEAFTRANPIHWLTPHEHMPLLIMHGSDDAVVPIKSAQSFYDQYSGPKNFYNIPGGSHLDSLAFAAWDTRMSAVLEQWLDTRLNN